MTELTRAEIAAIRIDKDQDIIPITVGLYKLFMASGASGREAKDLYEHLIFTARLQETQQVRANNVYLARGLSWGSAKVKKAKAWLAEAGLIEYVRTRETNGRVAEIYIMLRFLPRAETVAAKLGASAAAITPSGVEPAEEEDFREDLTPSLFGEDEEMILPSGAAASAGDAKADEGPDAQANTTGSEIEPLAATGSIIHPLDSHAHGAERQMLEVSNEMLEVKKGKGEEPAGRALIKIPEGGGGGEPHLRIATAYYRRYSKETGIMIAPRSDDHKAALELHRAVSGDLSALDDALEAYFARFRELDLWFAAKKASRTGERSAWIPDWSFRTFVARYPEIVAASVEKTVAAEVSEISGAAERRRDDRICPVCGGRLLGTMGSCPKCGFDWCNMHDEGKVREHAEWWEERKAGIQPHLNLGQLAFRNEESVS